MTKRIPTPRSNVGKTHFSQPKFKKKKNGFAHIFF